MNLTNLSHPARENRTAAILASLSATYGIRKMQNNMTENQPVTIDGASLHVLPTPPVIHLKTADDVRLEMAKVYRDMRQGRVEMADGTKLAYVLGQLNKAIETGIIEARMEALERTLKGRKHD